MKQTNPFLAAEAEAEGKGGTPKGGESQEGHLTLAVNEVVSDVYFCPYLGRWSNLTNMFQNGLKPPTSQIKREMATCSDSSPIFCLISGGYTDRESSQNNVFLIFVTLNWLVAYSKLTGLGGWWSFNFEAKEEQFQLQIKEFKRLKCFQLKWYSTSRSLVLFVSRSTDVGGNISWEVRWINTSNLGHPS